MTNEYDEFEQVPANQPPRTFVPDPESSYQYAPVAAGEVAPEKRAAIEAEGAAIKAAASGAVGIAPAPELARYRSFVSPVHPEGKFLVKAGTLVQFRDPGSPTGFRDAQRTGDLWAQFHGGVLTTDDEAIIAWAEQHDGFHYDSRGRHIDAICMDSNDPRAEAWANLKAGQQNLANREPSIDTSFNVERMVFPERSDELKEGDRDKGSYLPMKQGGMVDAARRAADQQNSY